MDAAARIGLIQDRAARAGIDVAAPMAGQLARYVEILAKWNRRINLTALVVDPPAAAAIDRLVVEPLVAAKLLTSDDHGVMDIGSGGGSPAIPMKIAAPERRFVLVEVKDRKSAFLREVIRQLALRDTEVRTARAEDLSAPASARDAADVVSLRAVRLDDAMVEAIRRQLRSGGRLFWFQSTESDGAAVPRGLDVIGAHGLVPGATSRLLVTKATTSNC